MNMSDVTRYQPDECGWMKPANDGNYVLFDEHEAALATSTARIAELEKEAVRRGGQLQLLIDECNQKDIELATLRQQLTEAKAVVSAAKVLAAKAERKKGTTAQWIVWNSELQPLDEAIAALAAQKGGGE